MCESERLATQEHADSTGKRGLSQIPVISAQKVSQDFVPEGGSVCHHGWGLLLIVGACIQPVPCVCTSPADGMEKVRGQTNLRLKTGSIALWLVRSLSRFKLSEPHLENGSNNEILYIILPSLCHAQELTYLKKKKISK